ncbi:hypothetical protein D9M71_321610 [compost metagenome]
MMDDHADRTLLHTRQVTCTGYLRKDGLIDIEGHITDVKPHDCRALYRVVEADTPFHKMRVVMTVDWDFVIRNITASTELAPTPFCSEITAAYEGLKGLKIGPGFKKKVSQIVGGVEGCTHLTELLGPMATTLYQTTYEMRREAEARRAASDPDYQPGTPWMIGSCHTYQPDSVATHRVIELREELIQAIQLQG